jgi:hypothetical protein
MFAVILVVLLAGVIFAVSVRAQGDDVDYRVTGLALFAYAIRLLVAPLTHTIHVFSTPSGVDSAGYEGAGEAIARLWTYTGIHYVSGEDLLALEHVSLPPNLFALVVYLNGGPSHIGCVAIIAAAASLLCLDLYLLSVLIGARREVALAITALIAVLPSFLYYTSDTYKDGLVAFLAIGAFSCCVRLAHRFSLAQLAWALVLLLGLWNTRYYLVFVMPAPLIVGLLGLRSGSVMRVVLAVLVICGGIATVYAYTDFGTVATDHAVRTFQSATSQDVIDSNSESGSGVNLGTGLSAFPIKLAYTLFSPFPWQAGSLGLQIEKLEAFTWYFFFYRAIRAVTRQGRELLPNLLLFLSFLVPVTAAYAFSFSNIGLIVRQRIDIVLVTFVLASVSWSAPRTPVPVTSKSAGPLGLPRASARRTFGPGQPRPQS